jgi:hypothetical protein
MKERIGAKPQEVQTRNSKALIITKLDQCGLVKVVFGVRLSLCVLAALGEY